MLQQALRGEPRVVEERRGQTPRRSATATETASANAAAGDTGAQWSSPTGSRMYIATTTRR